jgi:hypothetical protein
MKKLIAARAPLALTELPLDCLVAVDGGGIGDSTTNNEHTETHTDTSQHDSNNQDSSYSNNDYSKHSTPTGSNNGGNVAIGTQGVVIQGPVSNNTVNYYKK